MTKRIDLSDYKSFRESLNITVESVCLDFIHRHRDSIKIKKENVALKNIVTIVRTTLKLSNEKGFQNMTVRDLSRESGLSMGALYSYFQTKAELLRMIHEQGQHTVLNVFNEIVSDGGPEQKLESAVLGHLYLSELMHQWFYFFYMETKNHDKSDQKKFMESELKTEKIFLDIINEGIAAGVFKTDNPVLTASLIKAMLQDWYLKRWKYLKRRVRIEDYGDFVTEFIKSGIL